VYSLARHLLFRLDPERAHELAMAWLRRLQDRPSRFERMAQRNRADTRLRLDCLGHHLPGPLGVAAGFDKGAEVPDALLGLGFSHVEVGTLTPRPQPGNPKPRLERYPQQGAIVNRLGFNNPGMEVAADRLAARRGRGGLVGANVGANKDRVALGDVDAAIADYVAAAGALARDAGYVTVNVSSPNTPGLRALQTPQGISRLVGRVVEALDEADSRRPVLVKLHPDAEVKQLVAVAASAVDAGAGGIIAVNTTTSRPAALEGAGAGGLSGRPLRDKALRVMRGLSRGLDDVPLIGVGGIGTGRDAAERIAAGASLLQGYTAFVFRGPGYPVRVHRELVEELDRRGLDSLVELRGSAA
jgi:dihydroorotate dehydrogenase